MTISQQILFLISGLGAFNGYILGFYLFLQRKNNAVAIYMLAVFLLALSTRVSISVMYYFNPGITVSSMDIYFADCYLIGPSLYYFFLAVQTRSTTIPLAWKRSWAIQLGVLVVAALVFPYLEYRELWDQYISQAIYIQWFVYLLLTAYLLRNLLRSFFTTPASLHKSEKFLAFLFLGGCFVSIIYLFAIKIIPGICISGGLSFSLISYISITFYFYNGPIEYLFQSRKLAAGKTEKRKIPERTAELLIEKLEKVIIRETLYKDPNLKLNELAHKINVSGHQLSQLLNDNLGKSFSTYINEYRIKEACELINNNDHYTFEAIGYEVGFNSKSTFYAVFKKIKGITPALHKETLLAAYLNKPQQ